METGVVAGMLRNDMGKPIVHGKRKEGTGVSQAMDIGCGQLGSNVMTLC
jgi:hypothetical protein